MLDINYIRENKELVEKSAESRKTAVDLDKLLQLDDQRRDLIQKVDDLRAKRNEAAKVKDIEVGRKIKEELGGLEKQLDDAEKNWYDLMLQIPNILLDEVPIGDISLNKVVRKSGEPPKFNFKPRDHIELGKMLDIIDFDRGVKVSGFRGYFLKNEGAMLQLAILNYALDHIVSKGYQLVIPPTVVRGFALEGAGQFPWGKEETFKFESEEDLWLTGTAEVSLMAMHSNEVLDIKDLPKKYVGISACYRTEVGSYGKDTKGLYRVHEFYKVEQLILCENNEQQSLGFFEELQDNSEEILQELGLPYQVVCLSSEDMPKKFVVTYDIETWMSGRESYGETHSNSVAFDFQTRRLKIRYRDKDGKIKFCHALNNTAIASPRILIPLLENFQAEDGSVKIPEVLQKYTNFSEIKPK